MNKILYGIIIVLLGIIGYMMLSFPKMKESVVINKQLPIEKTPTDNNNEEYFDVYQYDRFKQRFKTFTSAKSYGEGLRKAYILNTNTREWMWDNLKDFIVYSKGIFLGDHADMQSAYQHAKTYKESSISYKTNSNILMTNDDKRPITKLIEISHVFQNPQLPRGCEVTALSMLLESQGFQAGKMELAAKVKKEPGIYVLDGETYYGNPEKGFVGNMYTLEQFGFGVFNKPIEALVKEYAPKQVINLSGSEFEDVLNFVGQGVPVWVIINTRYQPLKEELFTEWTTKEGQVVVTNKQHAVVITGYDQNKVYMNDPLGIRNNADINKFKEAWEQMGKQAITIMPLSK